MEKYLKDQLMKMKETAEDFSRLITALERTPDILLVDRYNDRTFSLYKKIMKLYSQLKFFHIEGAGLYDVPKRFPDRPSEYTEIQELRDDYIRIKTPLLYTNIRTDYLVADDIGAAFFNIVCEGGDIPRIDKKEIIFTFHYNTEIKSDLIRDNDNYNIKAVINTIVRYMRSSDSGPSTWLNLRAVVEKGIENHTIIEVKKME